jgi:hypothetical protein
MDTQTQSPKKGFNFKGLFVKEDVPTSKPAAAPAAAAPLPPLTSGLAPGPLFQQPGTPLAASTSVDPKVRDVLLQSLQENSLSGYDYLKFMSALEEMKSYGNEEARFKMVSIAAKQLGVDKAKLIQTAQHYIQVLQQDLDSFHNQESKAQLDNVGVHENRVKDIDAVIATKSDQIQKLNAEVSQLQQEKVTLSGQIMDNRNTLEIRKRSFEVTHAAMVSEIEANIQKINQYIA